MRRTRAEDLVLAELLRRDRPVTRPQIAASTRLSAPSVGAAVDRLLREHLVDEVGQRVGDPGRSPALYEIARRAGLLGAMDFGGSNVRVAVTDVRGVVLAEGEAGTTQRGATAVVSQAIGMLEGLRARLALKDLTDGSNTEPPPTDQPLTGVAVSAPGVVDQRDGSSRYAWNVGAAGDRVEFGGPIAAALGCPVWTENNVNLAALAERWRGVARGATTFAVVCVGAGVGAGIVHEGGLIRGANGAAGEVSFLPVTSGFDRARAERADEAGGVRLLDRARAVSWGSAPPPSSVEEIFTRAAFGHAGAIALVAEQADQLAVTIASIAAVIDPELVVLSGGIGRNPLLLSMTKNRLSALAPYPPLLVASPLGERASLVGAIRLASDHAHRALLHGAAAAEPGM